MPSVLSRMLFTTISPRFRASGFSVAAALLTIAVFAPLATATNDLFWDPSVTQNGTGSGGAGNWNLTDTDWLLGGTVSAGSGTGAEINWTDTTGGSEIAEFYGTAGTVTLTSNLGANGLVFGTTGYTIAGSNTLTLGSSGIVDNVANSTISANLSLTSQTWNIGSGATLNDTANLSTASSSILTIAGGGNVTFGGVLSGSLNLVVSTTGTVLFNGSTASTASNASTGVTVSAGTLALDFTNMSTPTNLISSVNPLTFDGGSLMITAKGTGATSQTFNHLNLNGGYGNISLNSGSGSGVTLALPVGIIRNFVGDGVNFNLPAVGSITAGNTSNTHGILGGWATVNGTTWATMSAGAVAPLPLSSYTPDTWAVGDNTDVTTSDNPASAATTNSLRFNTANALTLTLSGANILTSGGILETANVGSNANLITGGTIEGQSGVDLIVNQLNTSGNLTIASLIANNSSATALTLNGPGTVTLTNASNSYTGGTYINGTVLNISADTDLGPVPGSAANNVFFNGGTLNTNGGLTIAATRGILVGPSGGTITGGQNTILGNITGTGTLTANSATLLINSFNTNNISSFAGTFVANATTTIYGGLSNGVQGGSSSASWVASTTGSPSFVLAPSLVSGGTGYANNATATIFMGSLSGGAGTEICGLATGNTYTATLEVGALNTNTTYAGVIANNVNDPNAGSATLALEKVGTGILTLTGANTFSGGVILNGGEINLGSHGAIGSTGTITFDVGLALGTTGTLQYSAANTTDYSARFANDSTGDSTNRLSVDTNGQSVTWGSPLTSSNGNLTKFGAGTLTLTAAETYSTGTYVNGGTLAISGNGAVGGSLGYGAVTVNSGGTLAPVLTDANTIRIGIANGGGNSPMTLSPGSALNLATATTGTGIGVMNIYSNAATGLTIGGATGAAPVLTFNLGAGNTSDAIALLNSSGGQNTSGVSVGATGAVLDFIVPSGVTSLNTGDYTLITAHNGLGSGFTIGNPSDTLIVGLHTYTLGLTDSSATSEVVTLTAGANITPTNLYWINGDGAWTNGNHWSLTQDGPAIGGIPGQGTNTYIIDNPDSQNHTTTYDYSGAAVTLGSLSIDGTNGATNTLNMSQGGALSASAITVGANGILQGYGTISASGALTNNGMISANSSAGSLTIQNAQSLTNSGSLQASAGGTLTLSGLTITNSNLATITAGSTNPNTSGTVILASSTISGGTISSLSGGFVEITGANSKLDGSSLPLTISTGSNVYLGTASPVTLAGMITNNGTISDGPTAFNTSPPPMTLAIADGTVLSGSGSISMTQSGSTIQGISGNGTETLTNDITVAGDVTFSSVKVTNNGTINASAVPLTLQNGVTLTSTGTITASAGESVASTGVATLNQNSGSNQITAGNLTVGDQAAATGTYTLIAPGGHATDTAFLSVAGNEIIGNSGTGYFTQAAASSNVILSNSELVLGNLANSSGTYTLAENATLNSGGMEIIGGLGAGHFNQPGGTNTAQGDVSIAYGSGSTGTYALTGGLAQAAGSVYVGGQAGGAGSGNVAVNTNGVLTVTGTLAIYPGSSVSLATGGTINTSALNTNGTPSVFNWTGGTLNFTNSVTWDPPAAPTSTSAAFGYGLTIGANQTLQIGGDEFIGGLHSGFVSVGDRFALTLNSGATHTVSGNITVRDVGELTQNQGSTLSYGTLTLAGGIINGTIANATTFVYQSGTFTGSLINQGSANIQLTDNNSLGIGVAANNSSVTLSPGSTLNLAAASSGSGIGTLTITPSSASAMGLTIGGASGNAPVLDFNVGASNTADVIDVSGNVSVGNTGGVIDVLAPAGIGNLSAGNYTLIAANGGLGGAGFSIGNANDMLTVGGHSYTLSLSPSTSTTEILSIAGVPDNRYWIADGTSNWSAGGNWSATQDGPAVNSIPGEATSAYMIDNPNGQNRIVNYDYTGTPVTLASLTIDGTNGGTNTLNMSSGGVVSASTISVGANGVMQGYGAVQGATITNSGTINANQSGQTLLIQSSAGANVTNTGTLEATNGGSLLIHAGQIVNAGGTITTDAFASSPTDFSSVVINAIVAGGAISAPPSAVNHIFMQSGELDGYSHGSVTIQGPLYAGSASIAGTISMQAGSSISAGSGGPMSLVVGDPAQPSPPSAEFSGSGSIVMASGDTIQGSAADGSATLQNDVSSTIAGAGTISNLTLTNNGTINANQAGVTLLIENPQAAIVINANVIEATGGGILALTRSMGTGTFHITNNGTIAASGSGSTITLGSMDGGGLEIGGGSITSSTGATIQGQAVLDNGVSLSNAGTLNANIDTGYIDLNGPAAGSTNSGTMEATNGGRVLLTNGTLNNSGGTISTDSYAASQTDFSSIAISATISGGTIAAPQSAVNHIVVNGELDGYSHGGLTTQGSIYAAGATIAGNISVHGGSTISASSAGPMSLVVGDAAQSSPAAELSGSGSIVMATGDTIQGSAADGSATLQNDATSIIAGAGTISNLHLTNNGTINANVPGGNLLLTNLSGPLENGGTLEATSGGTLTLDGVGHPFGFSIDSHLLSATGSGSVVTIGAATAETDDIASFQGGTFNTGVGATIQGQAHADIAGVLLTNAGTFNANIDGSFFNMFLDPSSFNTGIMKATNGGTLLFEGSLNNFGGTITTDTFESSSTDYSTVQIFGIISGGTIIAPASPVNHITLGDQAELDGYSVGPVTIQGPVYAIDARIAGNINMQTDSSISAVTGYPMSLNVGDGIQSSAELSGSGSIVMAAGDTIQGYAADGSATLQNDVSSTIAGAGTISNLHLINNGIIDANVSIQGAHSGVSPGFAKSGTGSINANITSQTLTISSASTMSNAGTLEATSGGTLVLSGLTIDNTGGTVSSGTTATITLADTTINGGSASNLGTIQGTGTLQTQLLTNAGLINANDTGGTLAVVNSTTCVNSGTMKAANGGTLALTGLPIDNAGGVLTVEALANLTIAGTAATTISGGSYINAGNTEVAGGATLALSGVGMNNSGGLVTIDGTVTLTLSGTNTYSGGTTITGGTINNNGTFQGAGLLLNLTQFSQTVGTLNANVSNQTLTVQGAAAFTNAGTLEATAGGLLSLVSDTVTGSGILLTGVASTLTISGSTVACDTVTNAGLLQIASDSAVTANNALNSSGTVTLYGTLTVSDATLSGGSMTLVSGMLNTGTLTVQRGAKIGGSGTIANTSAISVAAGAMVSAGPDDTHTGLLRSNGQIWSGGAKYPWKINDGAGTAGGADGWDEISATSLSFTSLSLDNPFKITLQSLNGATPGDAVNVSTSEIYTWVIAHSDSQISINGTPQPTEDLLATHVFTLDTSGFTVGGETFPSADFGLSLVSDIDGGQNLQLIFNATPEPGTALLAGLSIAPLLLARRRSKAGRQIVDPG